MSDLATLTDPRSQVAEAYRSLRTNLAFVQPGHPLRSLLVAGPAVSEADDAAVTLANLAVVAAQAGQRVVVVDADLRRPRQHALFGLANDQGLSSALVAWIASHDAPLPIQATGVERLGVVTSGPLPPNPAELLGAPGMAALLERLAAEHDLVLVGAPPIGAVTDAAALAPGIDGVLLVLAAGRSRRDDAQRARAVLDQVGARVIGVALTDVAPDAARYTHYGADRS